MLQSVKALRGGPILARDEKFGFVLDLYFEDRRWVLRYFVADTGRPMPQRSVLLAPSSIDSLDPAGGLHAALTRKEIEKLPDWLTERPVYLQHDMTPTGQPGDEHLRSSEFVLSCSVQARDGALGHVADLLLDAQDWAIPSLVIDTGHWLPGRRLRVRTDAVEHIDWAGHEVRLRLAREEILAPA